MLDPTLLCYSSMPKDINIALCLSGGGFRATLFHLGVLKRLDELGLLARVRMLSAVSGGAVTAALFHRYVLRLSEPDEISQEKTLPHDAVTSSRVRPTPSVPPQANQDDDIISMSAEEIDNWERDGRPLLYNWRSFETQLLQATRAGILGPYMKSFAVWILGGLGLFAGLAGLASYWLTATWAGGWLFLLVGAFAAAALIFGGLLGFFVGLFVLTLLWLTPNWAIEWIFPLEHFPIKLRYTRRRRNNFGSRFV
jgi:Patatin-like phospholipase